METDRADWLYDYVTPIVYNGDVIRTRPHAPLLFQLTSFSAFCSFSSDSTLGILKIVGICVGALSLLCLLVSCCLVYYKKRHNPGQPGIILQGTDNAVHVGEDTRNQTTSF